MSNYQQDFGDVDHDIAGTRGVLGGDAFDQQERVIEKLNPQRIGFDFQCRCQSCGRPSVVTLTWPEILVASCGRVPADSDTGQPWVSHDGKLYPPVRCTGCAGGLFIPMTPDKAMRLVETGIKAQHLQQHGPKGTDAYRAALMRR